MTMYHQDPDVVRWGLHLLDICSISNAGSCGSVTHYDHDTSNVEYVREGYVGVGQSSVENDERIAHALQEELSRVALEEASGVSTSGNEHLQASVLAQDWVAPSRGYSNADGYEGEQRMEDRKEDEADNHLENANFHSSPGEKSCSEDDVDLLNIADESMLDGEVGKRLNQMVSVLHVPKTNGEIPTLEEEVSDHQRLLDRLQLYDLVENTVQGDGNCQFRALSDQLYRSPDHHKFVRQQVIQQLESHPEIYDGYVPMAYGNYLKKMSRSGEWGDHVTLQAAADSYGVKIFVITSFKDTCYIEILPHILKSNRVIFLSFWAEVHYNSIYPEGELPASLEAKRKKWWGFF